MCLISPISFWHVTRLSHHLARLMNERESPNHSQSKIVWMNEQESPHHSQSKNVCRNLLRLRVLKHWDICIAYWQWRSDFPKEEENQNTERKTKSYVLSGFGNGICRGWERKSTTGRFATGRLWPFTWKISSVGTDQVNNWEFCVLKITPIVLFL